MEDETKITSIRIAIQLLERLRPLARMHERSINGEIISAIKCYIKQEERKLKRMKTLNDRARKAAN